MAKVSASILACDQMQMGEQILAAEKSGTDLLHVDIMDGVYVENLTFGPQTVRDIKRISKLPISAGSQKSAAARAVSIYVFRSRCGYFHVSAGCLQQSNSFFEGNQKNGHESRCRYWSRLYCRKFEISIASYRLADFL